MAERISLLSLFLSVAVGGCETASTYSSDSSEQTSVVHPGQAAVRVVSTPVYLAFKGIGCAVSAAIAAPVAGLAALSESPFAPKIRDDLGDGLRWHCGPPYTLTPNRVIPVEEALNAAEMTAPERSLETPTGVSGAPVPPQLLEPVPGEPEVSALEEPPELPADYSGAPMAAEFPEPAAGGPIELFKD